MSPMTGVLEWKYTGSFRRTARRGEKEVLTLYVNKQMECIELCLGMDEELAMDLGYSESRNIIVRVSYKPPDQKYQADKALYGQIEVSYSQALILMGDFNYPDIYLFKGQHSRA